MDADWGKLNIQPNEIREAVYDALPGDYQNYLTQVSGDWQTMPESEFVEHIQTFKQLDRNEQFKISWGKLKRKKQNAREQAAKAETLSESSWSKKARWPDHKPKWGSCKSNTPAKHAGPRPKKFCQHYKDSGRQFWTHNTDDCYFKKPAAKPLKESNMIEDMKK